MFRDGCAARATPDGWQGAEADEQLLRLVFRYSMLTLSQALARLLGWTDRGRPAADPAHGGGWTALPLRRGPVGGLRRVDY